MGKKNRGKEWWKWAKRENCCEKGKMRTKRAKWGQKGNTECKLMVWTYQMSVLHLWFPLNFVLSLFRFLITFCFSQAFWFPTITVREHYFVSSISLFIFFFFGLLALQELNWADCALLPQFDNVFPVFQIFKSKVSFKIFYRISPPACNVCINVLKAHSSSKVVLLNSSYSSFLRIVGIFYILSKYLNWTRILYILTQREKIRYIEKVRERGGERQYTQKYVFSFLLAFREILFHSTQNLLLNWLPLQVFAFAVDVKEKSSLTEYSFLFFQPLQTHFYNTNVGRLCSINLRITCVYICLVENV